MVTWKQLLEEKIKEKEEDFSSLHTTLTEEELNKEFDPSYGSINGVPFTAWTKNYVYFPTEYDGKEEIRTVPRNPCNIKTYHI